MIVLDASAVIELLVGSTTGARVAALVSDARAMFVPHLLDVEVSQVLRRLEASKALTRRRARDALADFRDLDLVRYEHEPLLDRIWELRGNLSAYDATYVALAEATGATLITCDAKLASVRASKVNVVVVATPS